MMVLALVVILGLELCRGAGLSLRVFGWRFLGLSHWNPVNNDFGPLPCIVGTFVSSLLGLAIALPLSLATAVYLTELAPGWARRPVITLIEMLASVPSVILGLWGMYVLLPWLAAGPYSRSEKVFGIPTVLSGAGWRRLLRALRRHHDRHHDRAHHHLHLARGLPLHPGHPAGSRLCPRGDPLGGDPPGRGEKFHARHLRGRDAGAGAGVGRNDGR